MNKLEFYKKLSLMVVNSIADGRTNYTEKRKLREIKAELRLLGSLVLSSGNRIVNSKYFMIIPGKDGFQISSVVGEDKMLITDDNISLLKEWVEHGPKPTNLLEWRKIYGK